MMPYNPQIQQLLDELLDSQSTPENVCRSYPELLPEVRARWRKLCLVQGALDAMFPASTEGGERGLWLAADEVLPQLPGYEVEAVVGRGGMGVVYKARHLRLNRNVALKMLLAGPYAGPNDLERFLREAEAVAGLRHANIVQVYDIGDLDGRPYFTMELIEGGSLARKLGGSPLSAREAAALVAEIADAVQTAHQCGIVHRDLKPGNVLLAADGRPKVTDFGLARRLDGGGLTLTGLPVGTPSYMAPEQARGDKGVMGPALDVYALGAILFECLTGRPPFRAETAALTLQQVLAEDPVPPARLNPGVPRDLETICLKCLNKEPPSRYASARELADDLRRFERGEPIAARPLGRLRRWARWARRRPTAAALAATLPTAVMLGLALIGNWLWVRHQQAAIARAVEGDLHEAARLQEISAWSKARAVLDKAEGRFSQGGSAELRQGVDNAKADLDLATQLETIRLKSGPLIGGNFSRSAADSDYQAAFRDAKLAEGLDDPNQVAARIKVSAAHRALVAALDDWAVWATDRDRRAWCLESAKQADPDPDGWRNRVRDPKVWQDKAALAGLAETAPVVGQPTHLLVAVLERLQNLGGDATRFLKAAQRECPADFWVNFELGNALVRHDPKEAIGYYRAALAVRPEAVVVSTNLAFALKAAGQLDDAIACYQWTIRMDPLYAPAHSNLGVALKALGKQDESIACFRRALEIDPQLAHAHGNLANALRGKGDLASAIKHYEQAAKLAPWLPEPHYNLGLVAKEQGRLDDAIHHFEKAIQIDPKLFQAHNSLGFVFLKKGRLTEAIDHYKKAVAIEPKDALSQLHLGQALRRNGRLEESLPHLHQACFLKKEYLAAARMYVDAFASEPKLAENLEAGHRYRAACAAALVGWGDGADAANLGEDERSRWRRQACTWLRADLDAWGKILASGSAGDCTRALRAMEQWRTDPDLTGLRDPDALNKLPPTERQECRTLWNELEAHIKRAGGSN